MDDDKIISKYLKYLAANNPSSLKLNDDVFFDKKNVLLYPQILIMKKFTLKILKNQI